MSDPNTTPALEEASPVESVRALLAVGGVLYFFTGLDNYAFRFMAAPAPIYAVLLFVAAAAAIALLSVRDPSPVLSSPIMLWAVFFFVVTTVWAIGMSSRPLVQEALRTRYRSIGVLVAFALIFSSERSRRAATWAVAGAVVFTAAVNVAELAGVLKFVGQEMFRVGGRAGGLFINPNTAGLAIVFGLAVVIGRLPFVWRIPLLIVGLVGVMATFSRGAQLCFAVLVVALVWRQEIRVRSAVLVVIGIGLLAATQAGSVLDFLTQHEILNEETWARLRFEYGDSGRSSLALKAWEMFLDSPLVGKGLAATTDWEDVTNSSHNQFLNLAGDHGILGLLTFPLLGLALVFRNPAGVPFAAVLMLAGFVSHNLLDDRSVLVLISLAAACGVAVGELHAPRAPIAGAAEAVEH